MIVVKRTDSDGHVFVDGFTDLRVAQAVVAAHMNTPGVREITILTVDDD